MTPEQIRNSREDLDYKLYLAAHYRHLDLAKELLAKGASAKSGVVQYLRRNGSSDYEGRKPFTVSSPLCAAVQMGDLAMATCLLEAGAEVDAIISLDARDWYNRPVSGMTVLTIAVSENNLEMVNLLLRFHADPNKQNADDMTPLAAACSKQYNVSIELFELILGLTTNKNIKVDNLSVLSLSLRSVFNAKSEAAETGATYYASIDPVKRAQKVQREQYKYNRLLKLGIPLNNDDMQEIVRQGIPAIKQAFQEGYRCNARALADALWYEDQAVADLLVATPGTDIEGARSILGNNHARRYDNLNPDDYWCADHMDRYYGLVQKLETAIQRCQKASQQGMFAQPTTVADTTSLPPPTGTNYGPK